nr:hypothetical protein [Actinomadura fibrosa]
MSTLPSPTWLVTRMRPLWMRTSSWASASPIPVPSWVRPRASRTRWKRWNRRGSSSAGQVGRGEPRAHPAGFELGEVQQRVHQPQQPPGVAVDQVHVGQVLAGGPVGVPLQLLQRAEHQRQRRPELVRDVAEELGSRAVELGEPLHLLLHAMMRLRLGQSGVDGLGGE